MKSSRANNARKLTKPDSGSDRFLRMRLQPILPESPKAAVTPLTSTPPLWMFAFRPLKHHTA